jgi:hypothetical protein
MHIMYFLIPKQKPSMIGKENSASIQLKGGEGLETTFGKNIKILKALIIIMMNF